jgi:endonuclease/exonuclease/phosphatase family metal-dependent hydrolase
MHCLRKTIEPLIRASVTSAVRCGLSLLLIISTAYAQLRNGLEEIESGTFSQPADVVGPPGSIRVVVWNIERGLQLPRVIDFLLKANPDLVLLQEADLNARRTHHLNIAREIAEKLKMNYVFGREFQELTQGSGTSPAYHGQATLSRWPLSNPRVIRFREQSNFWRPRWYVPRMELFQERLGGRMAVVCDVNVAGQTLVAYNLHLESRGNDHLRRSQLFEVLEDSLRYGSDVPLIVAGDMNFDISQGDMPEHIRDAQFRNALEGPAQTPTALSSLFHRGRPIDWILASGPVQDADARIYESISASDHFPLSLTLAFKRPKPAVTPHDGAAIARNNMRGCATCNARSVQSKP